MSKASNLAGFSTSVVGTSPNNLIVGVVTATSFYGDGSNLSNTGSTLGAASGSQRLVVTSQTSGTMTSVGTDADLSWDSTTNTLSATNVSIAGTLTYEDVTNVDSVGVVTARSGIVLGPTANTIQLGTGTTISSPASDTFTILTGGSERVRVDSNGNFGLSVSPSSQTQAKEIQISNYQTLGQYTTSASTGYIGWNVSSDTSVGTYKARQTGDRGCVLEFTSGANFIFKSSNTSTGTAGASFSTIAERVRISAAGGFSVGTTADPGAGAIYATGDITAFYSSDIRLKKDIQPISEPIKKLMEISGVTYKWNEEYLKDKDVDGYFVRETEVGVIAQDVEKVLPEVVATRENGYKAVRYEKLVALLIEAVKDQQKQIDELKARLEEV